MHTQIAKGLSAVALISAFVSCSRGSEVSTPTEPSTSFVSVSGPRTLTLLYLCKGSDLMGSLSESVVVSQSGPNFYAALPRGGSLVGSLNGTSGTATLVYTYPSNYALVSPGHLTTTGAIDFSVKPYPKARFYAGETDGCAFGYAEVFLLPN